MNVYLIMYVFIYSTFTYKLSFFVLHGTTIVDGQTEAVIDADALQTQLTAQSITTLTVNISTSYVSFCLHIFINTHNVIISSLLY